uniref:BRCT domain-containing protein n=1 Tax=Cucumis sativus TaxID=3659 RepID=A0A0A0L359_CUCSA
MARKGCLNEELYPVGSVSGTSNKLTRGCLTAHNSQEKVNGNLEAVPSSFLADSKFTVVAGPGFSDMDVEDGCLWDTNGHIFYSPLPCCVPLPGFENIRFCVSQYDDKDRVLLRNLCFVLGAKFVEKLTKKVTHLICKFTDGTKYEAACKWGKQCITAEWIYECVSQIFPPDCSLVGQDHSETSPIGALSNQWSKR